MSGDQGLLWRTGANSDVNVAIPLSFEASEPLATAIEKRRFPPALVCIEMSAPRSSVWDIPEVKAPPFG